MSTNKKKLILEITNLPDNINPELLQRAAEETLLVTSYEMILPPMIILNFVDPDYLRKLNIEFRNINSSTDVLTFPLLNECKTEDQRCYLLGEIYIDIHMVKKNAEEHKFFEEKELLFTFIHGCLHLLGYTHENETKRQNLITLQNEILKVILDEKH